MRNITIFIVLFFLTLNAAPAQDKLKESPALHGPYMGQKPPGMIPEIFAPGFISTEKNELNSVFTRDGKEFYFSYRIPGIGYKMYFCKETAEGWSRPAPVSFTGEGSDVDMCLSHDGKRMYFGSTRPVNGVKPDDFKIWYAERTDAGWSEAKYLESPVNSGRKALYPTFSKNGTMYFQAIRDDSFGSRDIYFSKLVNGKYIEPVHLGREINSQYGEGDVLIAPDESWIIVNSMSRPDGLGKGDLYISFKRPEDSWTKLKNMGSLINSPESDYCPMLSPDGKYFFFTSNRTGEYEAYWVSANFIQELKSAG